jgi:hypothetical protein
MSKPAQANNASASAVRKYLFMRSPEIITVILLSTCHESAGWQVVISASRLAKLPRRNGRLAKEFGAAAP